MGRLRPGNKTGDRTGPDTAAAVAAKQAQAMQRARALRVGEHSDSDSEW